MVPIYYIFFKKQNKEIRCRKNLVIFRFKSQFLKMYHVQKYTTENTAERLWEIPYWKEYADMLKSDVADMKNIGGAIGGSATAGKFLEHFTNYPWLHLDIAGPAILKDDEPYKQKGASGVGVRLLYAFAKRFAELN